MEAFAVAAPGLADLVAAELTELGISNSGAAIGGVAFEGSPLDLYSANLHCRIASRILVRLGSFRAAHFSQLQKGLKEIEWARYIAPGSHVVIRVSSKKSRLFHTDAISERVGEVLSQYALKVELTRAGEDDDEGAGPAAAAEVAQAKPQLLLVRLERDKCTISADSSGELLHRRGYRQAVAKAPLRETIAGAIMAHLWRDDVAEIVDPMCGSGTIPIESAMRARRIPPGWNRRFAFEAWPDFDKLSYLRIRDQAGSRILAASPIAIQGSDRDAGAISAAIANATRAGVAPDIEFNNKPISAVRPAKRGSGILVANPPYGERVSGSASNDLRNLYARFGDVAREHFDGWIVALFAADPALVAKTRLSMTRRFSTFNGGIRVGLWAMG